MAAQENGHTTDADEQGKQFRDTRPVQNRASSFKKQVQGVKNARADVGFQPNKRSKRTSNTQVTGSAIGYGNNASYGTHGFGTLDPRTVELQAKLRF